MIVRLSLLDRKAVLHYSEIVQVTIGNKEGYTNIGTCRVFRNEEGRHSGELQLNTEVSGELYFYYRSMCNDGGIYIFAGLDLMENQLADKHTTTLKEMIIG